MAWVAIEPLDGTNGAALNGTSGGSGWSAAWSGSTNFLFDTSFKSEGTGSVHCTTNNSFISRDLTSAVTAGLVSIDVARDSLNVEGFEPLNLNEVGTTHAFLAVNGVTSDVTLNVTAGGSVTLLSGTDFTANTFFTFTIEIDQANSQFRGRVNNGPWSSWLSRGFTSINRVAFDTNSSIVTTNYWIDNLKPGSNPPDFGLGFKTLSLLGVGV